MVGVLVLCMSRWRLKTDVAQPRLMIPSASGPLSRLESQAQTRVDIYFLRFVILRTLGY
jgi:hypothetical protein